MKASDLKFRPPQPAERQTYRDARCNSCGKPVGGEIGIIVKNGTAGDFLLSKTHLGGTKFLAVVVCNEKCRLLYVASPQADASITRAIEKIRGRGL